MISTRREFINLARRALARQSIIDYHFTIGVMVSLRHRIEHAVRLVLIGHLVRSLLVSKLVKVIHEVKVNENA